MNELANLMHEAVVRDLGNLPVSMAEPVPESLVIAWENKNDERIR